MSAEATAENSEVAILGRVLEEQRKIVSPEVARAWLTLRLPAKDDERLRELSAKSKRGELNTEEAALLENYLHVGRLLDLMKSQARLSLQATS